MDHISLHLHFVGGIISSSSIGLASQIEMENYTGLDLITTDFSSYISQKK